MIKILFVCHGNICRSPMAEFIFKKMLDERGVASQYYVSSAATSSEEIYNGQGNPVYPPAVKELAKHGISCGNKRAVQLTREDYEKYDLFICMDSYNIMNAERIFKGDKNKKLRKLMDYTDKKGDVADPWYTGNFAKAYEDIYMGCERLITLLEK